MAGRTRAVAMMLAACAVLALSATQAFAQAQTPSPRPITDYANYPLNLGIIPAGCTAQGADIVDGEQFSVNGGAPVADMRLLGTVPAGATITMTWTAFAPGCEGVGITLSRKISTSLAFDLNANQYLNIWSYCGPGGNPCTAPFSLTLDTSRSLPVACYQLDANIGPPLNDVGPAGAFYSQGQPFNMLISANNNGTAPCDVPPCPENPQLPAASAQCLELQQVTTTTTTTPTTAPPVSTTQVPSGPPPAPAPTTVVCPPGQMLDTASGQCVAEVSGQELPFTGSSSSALARTGLLLLAAGALLLGGVRSWRRAAPTRG